mgnify:CR=1 FL=1
MCNLGSMDFLIMRNHDYLFIIANRGLKSIRASKHKKGIVKILYLLIELLNLIHIILIIFISRYRCNTIK